MYPGLLYISPVLEPHGQRARLGRAGGHRLQSTNRTDTRFLAVQRLATGFGWKKSILFARALVSAHLFGQRKELSFAIGRQTPVHGR